jgi:hypothetical protein
MEKRGTLKDTKTDFRNPCLITKDIYMDVDKKQIDVIIRGNFEVVPGQEEELERIVDNLVVAIDLPFFFNGDTDKFLWESDQVVFKDDKENDLLEPFQYEGSHFKAYDDSYDLNIEFNISSKSGSVKINKFPIVAYAYTEEGYKKIYQGINVTPSIKIDSKSFEITLQLKVF